MAGGGAAGIVHGKIAALAGAFMGEGHARAEASSYPLRPLPPLSFWLAIALWLAAAANCFAGAHGDANAGAVEGVDPDGCVFELTADAQAGDFGNSAKARAILSDGRQLGVLISYEGDELYFAGERLEGFARFSSFSDSSYERYAPEGIVCRVNLSEAKLCEEQGPFAPLIAARRWAAHRFDEIPGMGSALLRALLIGDRSRLEEDGLYDAMKTVGLAHMVAVSGSHLAVVGAFLSAALVRAGVPRRMCVVALCAFYAAYSVFTGMSAPVIRSGVMAGVAVSCVFAARRSSPLAALSVCVCVLIALEPANAVSLSFFLSAASTFGVVVFSGLFASWASAACGGRAPTVCETFGMTGAANLAIFPVTASVFSRIPLVSPLSNLLAAPVFSALLLGGLGALVLSAAFPMVGMAALNAMCALSGLFCHAAIAMSHIPCAAIPCSMGMAPASALSVLCAVVLWAWWPKASGRAVRVLAGALAAVSVAAAVALPRLAPDEIVMLDVGQGDAILIRSQGAALLVDTGNQDAKLMAALGRRGVLALDCVAITHHDDDHCGSLPVLDSLLARGSVCVPSPTFSCGCDGCEGLLESAGRYAGSRGVFGIGAGQSVRVGRFTCKAVWPERFEEEGGNADSLCLLVEYDAQGDGRPDGSALLTGDAEAEQLEAMVDAGVVGHVDVFKAGHHGSKNGASERAYARLSPEIALISAGEGNRYGHPAPETLEALGDAGAQVFRTDQMGDVSCRFSEEGIEVYAQKTSDILSGWA